jgi:hypothetical protein
VTDKPHEETFKVVDRRMFNADGQLREEAIEEQRRIEAAEKRAQAAAPPAAPGPAAPAKPAPQPSVAFKTLIGFLARNAELILQGIPDPRTGRPMLDIESLRQIIDMIEVLKEKTEGNIAPEEVQILTDLLADLKYTWVQAQSAMAAPAAAMPNPTRKS